MGWTSSYDNKHATIRDEEAQFQRAGYEIHETSTSGRQHWMRVTTPSGENTIVLVLVMYDRHDRCYYTKLMGEADGPYYWRCPKGMVRRAGPPANEYARQWRAKVLG